MPICCINDPDNFSVDTVMAAMKSKKVPKAKDINVSRPLSAPSPAFRVQQRTPGNAGFLKRLNLKEL